MPRIFGSKLIDGKAEKKISKNKNTNKKIINQPRVEFEDESVSKRN